MKKRLLVLTLTGALLLTGCAGLKTRQPGEGDLPGLEYTRPESEKVQNRESIKTLKSQGKLSDGLDYFLYANNELEISGGTLTSRLKSEKPLAEALKDVTVLTLNVEAVGEAACADLTVIQTVNLGPTVKTIGDSAFAKCTALGTIQFPASVTTVGSYAFQGCSSLWSADIPGSVTEMGAYVFAGCDSLRAVEIDTDVFESVFADCTALREVTFTENCRIIYAGAFQGCTGLRSLNLGSAVERIERQAFSDCEKLSYIYFPKSLTYIGHLAFSGVQNISNVEFEDKNAYRLCKRETDYAKRSNLPNFYPLYKKEKEQWENG